LGLDEAAFRRSTSARSINLGEGGVPMAAEVVAVVRVARRGAPPQAPVHREKNRPGFHRRPASAVIPPHQEHAMPVQAERSSGSRSDQASRGWRRPPKEAQSKLRARRGPYQSGPARRGPVTAAAGGAVGRLGWTRAPHNSGPGGADKHVWSMLVRPRRQPPATPRWSVLGESGPSRLRRPG